MRPHRALITLLAVLAAPVLSAPSVAERHEIKVEGKAPEEFVAIQSGKSWAVVIGIDDYELLPRLSYAVADAQAMARLLEQQGFHVTELYDKQATRRAILDELGNKLEERVSTQDRVVVFYAGHGETKKPKGEGKEMGYLMPANARRGQLADSAISMGLIQELADGLPAKHVLFLVDVCYAGIAGQRFRGLPAKVNEDYVKTITRERGRQLITAGGADQEALEGPEWGHSVFTHYLLEGLGKGLADLNEDGIIPASELHLYLDQRVFGAAQMKRHTQRPEMWKLAPEKGEFVFASVKKPTMPPATQPANPEIGGSISPAEAAALKNRVAELERMLAEKPNPPELPKPIEEAHVRPFEAPQQLAPGIAGKDLAPMILIPSGEFTMGSDEGEQHEKPVHRVYLDAFYMDKFEVTTFRYFKFFRATGRAVPYPYVDQLSPNILTEHGRKPVVGVDWNDANAYCRWAGKRLPTEAEWEKAARGTDARQYPWGDELPTPMHANFGVVEWVGYATLTPVGSLEAGKSPYGVYDLAGNVWEWVADWYDKNYYQFGQDRNPKGPPGGELKVIRGGSWGSFNIRSAYRGKGNPTDRNGIVGFRCAQDAAK